MGKEKIPESVRYKVWDTYIGLEKAMDKCFCCNAMIIQIGSFQCGHVVSEYHGGLIRIDNLRPICAKCNCSMGKKNMVEFMYFHGYDFRGDFNGKNVELNIQELINKYVKPVPHPKQNKPINFKIQKHKLNEHPDIDHKIEYDGEMKIEMFNPIKKIDPSTLWEWAIYKKL
jgi:hypothetical protein